MSSDLMFQSEIRTVVREIYAGIPHGAGEAVAGRLYSPEELAQLPASAISWALGVGNPVRHAGLRPGDTVLDLGSGGGIDTVLAAARVGPEGRVIAIDTLPEMCERTAAAAREAGVIHRCEILNAEMEDLPVPDASVDVVVSNGVPNLSPRKSRAFAEAARVLRPGGRFCVADLTVDDDLPPEVLSSGAAWAGCIAGALSESVFTTKLRNSGLTAVEFSERTSFSLEDVLLYPLFTADVVDLMRHHLSPEAQRSVAVSLIARATKPEDWTPQERRPTRPA